MTDRPAPAGRFADRADDYERGRPGYPDELVDALVGLAGLAPGARVADVGAGTGLSSDPWLARGFEVVAVEPEGAMRAAAERRLAGNPRFRAVAGSAEATGLDDASVDLVFAAQAFHWFEIAPAREEFRRILRPGGGVALVWNARRAHGSGFAIAYEALLDRHGTDYRQVGHRGVDATRLAAFFGGAWSEQRFGNFQELDRAGLEARLLSSSYVPAAGRPGHDAMMRDLGEIFDAHQSGGRVRIDYDCELFFGRLAGRRAGG